MGRVQGKVVLVTGGSRGMGAAHARTLVAEGAKVVISDILDKEGESLARELGNDARYLHLDVTSPGDWAEAVEFTVKTFGGLHVLVNNAGIANVAPFVDFPLEMWRKTLDINLTGVFLGMQAAIPAMAKSGGGSIINISSVEGLRGTMGMSAYVASKFGVNGITKSVALEVAKIGVRVNSVHPGFIATAMTKDAGKFGLLIPLERIGRSEEVSPIVLFLASDESSYATGSEFVIDGGLTAGIPMDPE
ncbi:MAG: glucose 1-dehydrogenase [Planctomycetia bacterium]